MRVGKNYFEEKKSSFLAVDKDLCDIVNLCLKNDDLCKLLYYTQPDCLQGQKLTNIQKLSLVNKQIRIIPNLPIQQDCPNYIVIRLTDFTPNNTNPEFRDCSLNFQILCHPDHWNLGNFALRPYKIAGELDAMFNKTKLTGIGEVNFEVCTDLTMDGDMQGLTMIYKIIHGVEDQINPLS